MFVPVRVVRVALAAAVALTLLAFARDARAGWSADPVEVRATTNVCPLVAVANDGARGSIVVWQENTGPSTGMLFARHLLANGDLDPAWPPPATVTSTIASRVALGAVEDGLGGAYVWWQVGAVVYLSRLGPDGLVAAGWPANGRALGLQFVSSQRPNVIADGAHGVYVSWNEYSGGMPWEVRFELAHIGPANTAAGGFPPGAIRAIGTTNDQIEWIGTSTIARSADGGVWAAWGAGVVTETEIAAGDERLVRLTAAGLPAAGWDARGVVLGSYPADLLNTTSGWSLAPGMALVAVCDDGAGGAYVEHGEADTQSAPGYLEIVPRLVHLDGTGALASGWPAGGLVPMHIGYSATLDNGATASFRVLSDAHGGVQAGQPAYFSENGRELVFSRYDASGQFTWEYLFAAQEGLEVAPRGDGGVYVASFHPDGPYGPYSPAAYVSLVQSSPGANWESSTIRRRRRGSATSASPRSATAARCSRGRRCRTATGCTRCA